MVLFLVISANRLCLGSDVLVNRFVAVNITARGLRQKVAVDPISLSCAKPSMTMASGFSLLLDASVLKPRNGHGFDVRLISYFLEAHPGVWLRMRPMRRPATRPQLAFQKMPKPRR